jgi:hypothetical protein
VIAVDATRAPIAGGLELTNFGSSATAAAAANTSTSSSNSSALNSSSGSSSGGVEVLRGEQHTARVIWRPRKPGKLRETLHFKLDGKWPLQVVVTGEALAAGAAGRRGSARGRSTTSSSSGRAAPLQLYGYGGDPTDAAATAILGKRRALSPDGKENAAADAAARRAHMLQWSAEATKGLRLSATSVNTAANTSSSANSSKNQLDASGEAEGGAQQPARKKAKGLAGSSVNTSSSNGNGGSSSAKTALLRKSLHDKRWAEKQAESFTAWLNFALLPKAEWGGSSDDSDATPSAAMNSTISNSSASGNSSSSAVSQSMFSKVRAARGEARARQRAMLLYRSPELSGMRAAVADKVCTLYPYTLDVYIRVLCSSWHVLLSSAKRPILYSA